MKLNVNTWKEFRLGNLFSEMYKAEAHVKSDLLTYNVHYDNTICFISRTETNNGCDCYVSNNEITGIEEGNAITIGDTTATFFYQRDKFACGDHIIICRAKWLNLYTGLFLITILKQEKYKYSYGRPFKIDMVSNTMVRLPVTIGNEPDWNYMEQYIKSLNYKPLTTANMKKYSSLKQDFLTAKNKANNTLTIEPNYWQDFKVGKLFKIEQTKGKITDSLTEGSDIPYISAKHDENGLEMLCSREGMEDWISEGNCIIFIQLGEGSCGYANYINEDFIGMYGKTCCGYIDGVMNPYIGLFLATILSQERPKHYFGRSWTGTRLTEAIIKLPVVCDKAGNPIIDSTHKYSDEGFTPDWKFMENYIKALPYGDKIQ